MKRKLCAFLAVLLAVLCLPSCRKMGEGPIFQLEADNVQAVVLQKNNSGEPRTVADRELVELAVYCINAFEPQDSHPVATPDPQRPDVIPTVSGGLPYQFWLVYQDGSESARYPFCRNGVVKDGVFYGNYIYYLGWLEDLAEEVAARNPD